MDLSKRNTTDVVKVEIDGIQKMVEVDGTLKARYEIFRKTYDVLVSVNLIASDSPDRQESTFDALIADTKFCADKMAMRNKSGIVDKSFKNNVPELLAHIFAIWTLQNTEYYNEMRGIDSKDAYLLRPHVAQIIAIFRILGIGYQGKGKSKDIFNNLVQIGTGE
ncbi:unnamed protein product, partial [Rotaria sp. Silwood2]